MQQTQTTPGRSSWTTLRVAVTGHRDLNASQEAETTRLAEAALESLVEQSHPARVELLTGLADGADLLVTRVALALDMDLHVVLPKPVEEYREELSAEAVAVLDGLIASPDVDVTVLGSIQARDSDPEGSEAGSAAYSRLGAYLAGSAHVLLALWDGSFERKPGGSFDVLARFLDAQYEPTEGSQAEPLIETTAESAALQGPTVIWIEVARGAGEAPGPAQHYLTALGTPGIWILSAEQPGVLGCLLDDAADLSSLSGAVGAQAGSSYPLLGELPADLDPPDVGALGEIQDAFREADGLAVHRQKRSDASFVLAGGIAAAMGFAFLWFAKIDDADVWLYLYLGLFIAGYLLFVQARRRNWLRQHLGLRIAAETLRVRFFATLLGLQDRLDVRRLLALTGVASFPGMAWAAQADRVGVPTTGSASQPRLEHMPIVREEWVDDQARYFRGKVETLEVRHRRLHAVTRVLYVLSFLTVIVLLVAGSELKGEYLWGDVSAKTFVVFLMGLLPLWLTVWELHQSRMATQELLWQARNQAALFSTASLELRWASDRESQIRVFADLAERSLFEAYLWTIHRFHREFEPPSGA